MAVLGRWKAANTANLIGVAVLMVFDDFLSRGESRKCGRGGQKSRFHRHRTRPPGVDDCGRGSFPPGHGDYSAIIETRARHGGYSAL